jgi:leucyl-tRNA synthetase
MSKSKGNVVSPDAFVEHHGSDVFRMYLMFMGPFSDGGDWNDTGIKGIDRFVQRVWDAMTTNVSKKAKEEKATLSLMHHTIKRVTESISAFRFNTAISALMEYLNALEKREGIPVETARIFTILLAPLAPHLAEELWEILGGKGFVIDQSWPTYEAELLKTDTITVVVQVNGKLRANIQVASDLPEAEILVLAKGEENVKRHLTGPIKKEIYVKGKLVNFVV